MNRWLQAAALALLATACQCNPPEGKDGGPPVDGGPGPDSGTPDGGVNDAGNNPCADWTQWGHDSAHSGHTCVTAQTPTRALASVVFDPFATREQWEDYGGDLVDHFPTPLLVGDDVYMLVKGGQYVDCEPTASGPDADGGYTGSLLDGGRCGPDSRELQVWTQVRYHWENGQLVEKWAFPSDWKPVTDALTAYSWEPVFQAAVAGSSLYVPGAGGTVHQLDRTSGAEVKRVNPFTTDGGVDPGTFLTGGITIDAQGNLFYNAISYDPMNPFGDATGTLVKVTPAGSVSTALYTSLVPGAPAPTDLCTGVFNTALWSRPFPPPPDGGAQVYPNQGACGSQRPGVNVTPVVGSDGTIYTASRAHLYSRYSYLVAVHPDLTPAWSVSLRDVLQDGCGALIPADSDNDGGLPDGGRSFSHCRVGTKLGVDPLTNQLPAGRVDDTSSSSPVLLPDGTLLYGALTTYNTSRGHLFRVDSTGVRATYDFGWDVTPAFWQHDGTYSIVTKDNHYFEWDGSPPRLYLTRLSPTLTPEWKFQNTDTMSCLRGQDGGVSCVADHPDGFEWCVNAPAIDATGRILSNAEDGNLYVLSPDGGLESTFFLQLALGAAYTPVAVDAQGRIYALNGGVMTVLGQ